MWFFGWGILVGGLLYPLLHSQLEIQNETINQRPRLFIANAVCLMQPNYSFNFVCG